MPSSVPAPTTGDPVRSGDELAQVAGAVAAVYRQAWGRGPVKSTAQWAGSTMLVVVLENGHTQAEKTLRAGGHHDHILRGRQLLQTAIEDELKSAVERITGRPVVTVLATTRLDPDLSAQIFLFAGTGPPGQYDPPREGSAARPGPWRVPGHSVPAGRDL